jgi:hypothetical protein
MTLDDKRLVAVGALLPVIQCRPTVPGKSYGHPTDLIRSSRDVPTHEELS